LLGANGIVEDFSILPRLLRDSLIIETWEGTHNTLALQLLRDLSRFDFTSRWNREIASVLERWPEDFLRFTRTRTSASYRQIKVLLQNKAGDPSWGVLHARRLVDGLAGLLGVAWMMDTALVEARTDATAALLAVLAADQLWCADGDRFESRLRNRLSEVAPALIDEERISPPAWIGEI
jgi:hypothetical protein